MLKVYPDSYDEVRGHLRETAVQSETVRQREAKIMAIQDWPTIAVHDAPRIKPLPMEPEMSHDRSHALDHVVLVLFENRALDNLLGHLYGPEDDKTFEGVIGNDLSNPIPEWAEHGAERNAVSYAVTDDMDAPNPDSGEEYFRPRPPTHANAARRLRLRDRREVLPRRASFGRVTGGHVSPTRGPMNSPSVRGARVTAARAQGRLDLIRSCG